MHAIRRLIPNLFTAGNLVGGILAIILALKGRLDIAPYFILASAVFDFLDGFMARLLKVPSELGKQLDSLADMVTFGVAPGIIVWELFDLRVVGSLFEKYSTYVPELLDPNTGGFSLTTELKICGPGDAGYLTLTALFIPVFALFRLAKFNLDTRQTDSFIGVPTPAATLFFASIPFMLMYDPGLINADVSAIRWFIADPWFLAISSLVMSVLMVSEIPLFALKFKSFGWKGNEMRYSFLIISIILLVTLFVWALPIIILLYILLSLISNIFNKGKKFEEKAN